MGPRARKPRVFLRVFLRFRLIMLPPATQNSENGSRTHFDSIWARPGALWATHPLDVSRCSCVSSFFSPCCSFCGKFAWGIPPDVSRCIRVWCQIVLKRTPLECRIPAVSQHLLWYMTSTRPLECKIPAVLQSLWRYRAVYGCIWLHMAAYAYIWLHMAVYGCIWLYMAVYGCIWPYVAVYGCIWLYMAVL